MEGGPSGKKSSCGSAPAAPPSPTRPEGRDGPMQARRISEEDSSEVSPRSSPEHRGASRSSPG
eukprot:15083633-Alexandrium_andersonii.AAC.1